MASMTHVSLSTAQGTPCLSSSLHPPTGSIPIRARITPEDDSSDFESDGHKTDDSDSNASGTAEHSVSIDDGSEFEEFASGEELASSEGFDTASERPFMGDPDEENPEAIGFVNNYIRPRPSVADPGEESSGNSFLEEEESSFVGDHSSPVVQLDRPIAHLSMDDEELDELVGEEGIRSYVEDDRFSGIVRVPSFGLPKRDDSAPSVELSGVEEHKEIESLLQGDSSFVEQLPVIVDEASALNNFSAADNGFLGSKDQAIAEMCSFNDFTSVDLPSDEGVKPANMEVVEDLTCLADDLVSVGVLKPEVHVIAPEGEHSESSEEDKREILEQIEKWDGLVKHDVKQKQPLQNIEQEESVLNCRDANKTDSMSCNPVDHASEQSFAVQLKEKISERLDGTKFADHAFESLITLAVETAQIVAPELQGPKFQGMGAEADESMIESIAMDKDRNNEKVEDNTGPVTNIGLDLPVSNDAIRAELIDAADFTNGLQTKNSLENVGMCKNSEGDKLAVAWQSNANSLGVSHKMNNDLQKIRVEKVFPSDQDIEDLIFGGSQTRNFVDKFGHTFASLSLARAENSQDYADEEVNTEKKSEGKELFDPAALAALSRAATTTGLDIGNVTVPSVDDPRVSSLEHPAGLTSLFGSMFPASASDVVEDMMQDSLCEEEKKIQNIGLKFLRLVHRLGYSPEEPIAAQVLHRLVLATGGHPSPEFSLESAWKMAKMLEMEGKDNLDFSLNILVLGKTGVGKSATINSVFKEERVMSNAFEPATTRIKDIVGTIDGVKIRMLDTPGLRPTAKEEATNRKILASIKKFAKKFPPDVVLYVDRLDTHARDLNDLPLLRSLTNSLTASIWQNAIVTLTHAASPLPDGPSGSPLNFEVFVAQQSHIIQQAISQAVGDLHLMHSNMMPPVSLVENHPSSFKNKIGENVLPNGQSWRPQLLLLCYSLKILSEASSIFKSKDFFDQGKVFGFQLCSPPFPHLVSSMLQSCPHPKLAADQGSDGVGLDSDEENEYEQLLPFKSLRKCEIDKISKEQRKAYFEKYDYRVKLFQRKQSRAEVKRLKEIMKKGKVDGVRDYRYFGEDVDQEDGSPATVPVPIPHPVLPPSFVGDDPSYGYRMLEPTSQLLVRPVSNSQGWDRDCRHYSLCLEQNIVIVGQFPGEFSLQVTKDKKEFRIGTQFSIGQNSKMAICAGMNNKPSGQIAVKTSSSELQIALIGIAPIVTSIIRRMYAGSAGRNLDMLNY
uniref:Uncharacterized protein MANES_15G012200 n=1 Tax=Rhizophora mucronata TaxID=61149 RepID=A0A2P2QMR5_RHIMU